MSSDDPQSVVGRSVIAHGVDLVEVARIERMLGDHGERFLDRVFTAGEREYAAKSRLRQAEHLAGRFAIKEAVLKALGTGWSGGIAWTDIEVVRSAAGAPGVVLSGEAAAVAKRLGVTGWLVSISHTEVMAMGSVIALG
jgi:holo-[acyl-carrier protein] synthase